jgi:hypothetical protein
MGFAIVFYGVMNAGGVYLRAHALASRGHQAAASVIETRTEDTGYKATSGHYFVKAEFRLPDGTKVVSECEVTDACYSRYRHASSIAPISAMVVYEPGNVSNWHPADDLEPRQHSAQWSLLFLSGLALVLLGLATWGAVGMVRARHSHPA